MVKNPPAHTGDTNLIPALGRPPGEGNGNPLQYSCLGNPMDKRGLAGYSSKGCKESETTEQLLFALSRVISGVKYFSGNAQS